MKKILSIIISISLFIIGLPTVPIGVCAEEAQTSPEKWLIAIDDKYCPSASKRSHYRMYLLDTEQVDGQTNYYCYSATSFSNLQFDVNGTATAKYNPNTEGNIAWWINTELYSSDKPDYTKMSNSSYTKQPSYAHPVPQIIRNHMIDHTFEIESGADVTESYSITAKMALLSKTEFDKYSDHFEFASGSGYVRLRSPYQKASADSPTSWCFASATGTASSIKHTALGLVRPCFWLNGEFFETIKLDIENTGEEVRKLLKQNYTKAELALVGYSEYELGLIGYDIDESIYVNEVKITEDKLTVPGYTLKAEAIGKENLNKDLIEYKWQYSADNFVWTDTDGGSNGTYQIENKTANGYVRAACVVKNSSADARVYSDSVKIGAALPSYTNGNPGVAKEVPSEYLVVMKDSTQTFSLLDTEEVDGKAQYFCYANFATGNMPCWVSESAAGNHAKFDPTNSSNIAYWMNDETNGMLAEIPTAFGTGTFSNSVIINSNIKKYAVNHDWLTEAGNSAYDDVDNDYVVYSKFALLSYNEYVKYKDKIGYGACALGYIRLRTPSKSTDSMVKKRNIMFSVDAGSVNVADSFGNNYIRPCFYLGYDFFENVKLDIEKSGNAVKAVLAKYYTDTQLQNLGYSDDEISLMKAALAIQSSTASIEFVNSPTFVMNKDNAGFNISIQSSVAGKFDVSYTVDGESVSSVHDVLANTEYSASIPMNTLKYGKHLVKAVISCNGITLCSKEQYVSVVKEYTAKTVDEFARVGINLNTSNETALKLLQDIGIKNVRYSISWNSYEKPKGTYDTESADEKMALLSKYGLSPIMTLAYTNIYYISDESAPDTPEEVEGFANYAASLAERYPQIKAFSIWNEPNIGFWKPEPNVADYTNLVKETSKAIKAVRPDAIINAGVLSKSGDGAEFGKQMLELDAARYIDSISFHPYSFPREADVKFDTDVQTYSSLGDDFGGWLDYRITEVGWPTHQGSVGVTEGMAARSLVKSAVKSDDADIKNMYWYNFVNSGEDITYDQDNFGLLNADFSAKEGYCALAQYMNCIGGKEYLGKIELGENSIGYLYNNSGNVIMVAWSTDADEVVTLPLEVITGAEDLYGNAINASTSITLTNEPIYIYGKSNQLATKAVYDAVSAYCTQAEITTPTSASTSADVLSQVNELYSECIKITESGETMKIENISNAAERLIRLYTFLKSDNTDNYSIQTDMTGANVPNGLIYPNKILNRANEYLNKAVFLQNNSNLSANIEAYDIIAGKLKSLAESLATNTIIIASETENGVYSVEIQKGTDAPESGRLFLAVYDEEENLISIDFEDITFDTNVKNTQLEGESIKNTNYTAKVMLWSMNNLKPFCPVMEVNGL